MRRICQENVSPNMGQLRLKRLQDRDESQVQKEPAVFGVVQDVGKLIDKKAGLRACAQSPRDP